MTLSPTARSTLRRHRERARQDRAELYALLDSALICHLGLMLEGTPVVLPTGYGRDGDTLYLHGSSGAASLQAATRGAPVCVTVTRLDGVVYARSAFHHSLNYASAVIHATARTLTGEQARHGLRVLVEHLAPGSWQHSRPPSRKELAATTVLAVPLAEASVKVRTGPPVDDEADVTGPGVSGPGVSGPGVSGPGVSGPGVIGADQAEGGRWAGVLPIAARWGAPQPCPRLPAGVPVPAHVACRGLPDAPA